MAHSQSHHSWLHTLSELVSSLVTTLLTFGAIPAVLVLVVGDPLSSGLGHQWTSTAKDATAALDAVAWVAWVACSVQLIRSVVDHVKRGHVHIPVGSPFTERIAARIAAGVLTLSALGAPMVVSTHAGATVPGLIQRQSQTVARPSNSATPSPSVVVPSTQSVPVASATYRVQAGDSLWTIADTQLGDGADWTAIAALNLGHTMNDGRRFVDPSMIDAGWVLQMPDTPSSASSLMTPPTEPMAASTPVTIPSALTSHIAVASTDALHIARASRRGQDGPGPSNLPELAILGLGAVGCAALARRSRHRHLLHAMTGQDPHPAFERPPSVVDAETLVGRLADVPALSAFEQANVMLRDALSDDGLARPLVRAVCVGPSGVDFWWTVAAPTAPMPFTVLNDGVLWRIEHDALRRSVRSANRPYLPIALVIGDDQEGTWLVPVQPGVCLPFLGESAEALWHSASAVQSSWAWANEVLVTNDPATASREVRLADSLHGASADTPQILFFGDPADLAPGLRDVVAIVTASPTAGSDVTVLVDRRAASIHPLSRVVRPHLIRPDAAALVAELACDSERSVLQSPLAIVQVFDEEHSLERSIGAPASESIQAVKPSPDSTATGSAAPDDVAKLPAPGLIEVKLLTATPRLAGLQEELPPNRARRAVELVAYLALHQPDAVTSDRLRTRVLGSSDADAASKTLFNTAAAARRAMGTDTLGKPLFPPGSRTGHYRVSEDVTVDVTRAAQLAEMGSATADPDVAIRMLRDALALIEGEPMANALSGFTWWEAEGHGARISAVLVHAACTLATLAVRQSLFDLAMWGLERARLVDPYSELLSQAAMQVAAADGDADRLRREWRECQRRVDELDPGGTPSLRTEQLYDELAQRVLVGATPDLLPT